MLLRFDTSRQASCAVALALVLALGSLPARAAPPDDVAARAQQLFQQGRDAYKRGDYASAVEAQHQAWEISQSFDIAANLGQAEIEIERYRDAATHLSYALDHFPASGSEEARARLKETFDKARARVGALAIRVDPARAEVSVDGMAAPLPLPPALFVDPGTHVVKASLAGHAAETRSVTSKAGDTQAIAITLKAETAAPAPAPAPAPSAPSAPAAPPTTDTRGPSGRTIALIAGTGITAIALGAGLVFKLKADASDNDASNTRAGLVHQFGSTACVSPIQPGATAGCTALNQMLDDRDSANRTSTIAFATGGVFAVATIAAFVLWPKDSKTQQSAQLFVVPDIGPHGGALGLSGSF